MTKKELLKAIADELGYVVNNINFINSGGCGFFAEHLYYTLKKFGFKPKIAVIGDNEEQIKYVITNNRSGNELRFSHIVLYAQGYYIDSGGVMQKLHSRWDYHKVVKGMSVDLLKAWNEDESIWNPTFDRRQVKYIISGFEKVEKKVKENLEIRNKRLTFAV